MKMRRHRVFLLCTVGLCVISFLHYYKALHYVSLLRELSAPYPNIKSFIMVTGFFWKERDMPLSSTFSDDGPAPVILPSDPRAWDSRVVEQQPKPELKDLRVPWGKFDVAKQKEGDASQVITSLLIWLLNDF